MNLNGNRLGVHESRLAISFFMFALAGCAHTDIGYQGDCNVYDFKGSLTAALIHVREDTESKLLGQVPNSASCPAVCWYQMPSGTIEAQTSSKKNLRTKNCRTNIGYEFGPKEDQWVFLQEKEYVLFGNSRFKQH